MIFCWSQSAAPILWILSNSESKNPFDTQTSLTTFFSVDCFKSAIDSPSFIEMPETMKQLRREYWCKLSSSPDSLLLAFWLTSSVDSRTTSLFSRIYTSFSSEDVLPWSTSTSSVNSEISSLDFVLISFLDDSNYLTADFPPFLPILFYIKLWIGK